MAGRRPFGVTLVAIIAWITGALQIIAGVLLMIGGEIAYGIIAMLIGFITILVSLGLFGGSNGARILTAVVFVLNIAGSVYLMITEPSQLWTAVGSAVLPLIGLLLLFTSRANSFFR